MGDTSLTPLEPDAVDLDGIAQRLNDICRSATFDLTFRIGQLIIQELFVGCPLLWEKHGIRSSSYRALAARGDLMLSASALCRAVGIYVLVERLGGRERWRYLSTSHFQEVLSLDVASSAKVLTSAEENRWPVSRVRSEVRTLKRRGQNKGTNDQAKVLKRLSAQLASCQDLLCAIDLREAEEEASPQVVRETVNGIYAQMSQLSTTVEERSFAMQRQSDVREPISCPFGHAARRR
jgi:hypothetical protein